MWFASLYQCRMACKTRQTGDHPPCKQRGKQKLADDLNAIYCLLVRDTLTPLTHHCPTAVLTPLRPQCFSRPVPEERHVRERRYQSDVIFSASSPPFFFFLPIVQLSIFVTITLCRRNNGGRNNFNHNQYRNSKSHNSADVEVLCGWRSLSFKRILQLVM